MKKLIYILNGPNLNLLGEREPDIYGSNSIGDVKNLAKEFVKSKNAEIIFKQSNYEGELIELIHDARKKSDGLIINPAGYTHTSVAIYDALLLLNIPVIEVHISNIYRREKFRHSSYISMAADSVISGFGIDGYIFALESIIKTIENK